MLVVRLTSVRSGIDLQMRTAVIGCGAISADHLQFIAASPRTRLVAVCDLSAAAAQFASKRFGADGWYTDAAEMLSVASPDVVHVLTPPESHLALVTTSLAAGCHVVCEKPLGLDEQQTIAIVDAAERVDRVVVESRNLLYNDAIARIDGLIEDGTLGDVREVDVALSLDLTSSPFGDTNLTAPLGLPGGAIHDFLPHLAYLVLHFLDRPSGTADLDRVVGTLRNLSGNPRVGYDFMDALVMLGSRRSHLRVASDLGAPAFRVWVRGSSAAAEVDLYNTFLSLEGGQNVGKRAPIGQFVTGLGLVGAAVLNVRDKLLQHGPMHGLARMLDHLYTSLQADQCPYVERDALLASARLVDRLVGLGQSS